MTADFDLEEVFRGLTPEKSQQLAERIRTAIDVELRAFQPDLGRALSGAVQGYQKDAVPEHMAPAAIEARGAQLYEQYQRLSLDPIANFDALQTIGQEIEKVYPNISKQKDA